MGGGFPANLGKLPRGKQSTIRFGCAIAAMKIINIFASPRFFKRVVVVKIKNKPYMNSRRFKGKLPLYSIFFPGFYCSNIPDGVSIVIMIIIFSNGEYTI